MNRTWRKRFASSTVVRYYAILFNYWVDVTGRTDWRPQRQAATDKRRGSDPESSGEASRSDGGSPRLPPSVVSRQSSLCIDRRLLL